MKFFLTYWRVFAIAAALLAAAAFGAYKMHVHDQIEYDLLKSEYDVFKGGVAALGEAAKTKKAEQEKSDAARKKRADDELAKTKSDLAGLYDAYGRLRDQRRNNPSGSVLPAAAPGAVDPDRACFSRASLDRGLAEADGLLQDGAAKILLRGDTAISGLNTAKRWAGP
jgi:hypothetical protein